MLATTAKDKQLRLFDPRTAAVGGAGAGCVSSATAHVGLRFSRTVWLGNSPYLLTVGHNNAQEREFMLWDARKMGGGAVKRERVDSSYGPLIPLYDPDHNLLLLLGKGDASLRMYEVDTASAEGVTAVPLSNNNISAGSSDVIKGGCLLPKQANDLMGCEVLRLLKLTDNTVQPVSITVPRREKLKFQEDLFPPTYSQAPASQTAAEWLAGGNAPLTKVVLTPKASSIGGSSSKGISFSASADAAEASVSGKESPVPSASAAAAAIGAEEDEADVEADKRRAALSKRFSSMTSGSKFRHMYGAEYPKDSTFYNLAPDLSAMDSPVIACSDKYFAIPHRAGGELCLFV